MLWSKKKKKKPLQMQKKAGQLTPTAPHSEVYSDQAKKRNPSVVTSQRPCETIRGVMDNDEQPLFC